MRRLLSIGLAFLGAVSCSDVTAPASARTPSYTEAPAAAAPTWQTQEIHVRKHGNTYRITIVQDSAGVIHAFDVECRSGYSMATGRCLDADSSSTSLERTPSEERGSITAMILTPIVRRGSSGGRPLLSLAPNLVRL